jgi:DNA-binding PadR family transcriptional regulator
MTVASTRTREAAYFVLSSLADGPLPGGAIIRDVGCMSDGRVRLATGSLFGLLDRLTGEGFVLRYGERPLAGRARPCYALTRSGLSWLHAEASRTDVTSGLLARAGYGERIGRIVSLGSRVRLGGRQGVL